MDVYLAIGLVYDSSFGDPTIVGGTNYPVYLSENSLPTQCGPTIAEPTDLQPKIRRQLRDTPRPDRKR